VFHQARTVCRESGFAPYGLPGSTDLGEKIAAKFAEGYDCVILENHGAAVAGSDLQNAFQRFETFEFCAKTIIKASMLGQVQYLSDEQIELPRATAKPLPEFERGDPNSKEKELRRQLCEFVRRGYQQRLLISTEGSFSARLDDTSFLITPYRLDRSSVNVQDIVLVKDGKAEAGKIPSRASGNHRAIYRQHSQIHAVVNAYPVNATAFSATGKPVDCRTIPESYVFLREVNWIPYGAQFRDSDALAQRISPRNPVAVLENDGVLVAGASVLDAFDRLEVLESTAEALINSHAIGEPAPMSDAVIRELTLAFFNE
jgi:L-fuculose-phosphate aldolase